MGDSEQSQNQVVEAYRCGSEELSDPASGLHRAASVDLCPLSQQLWQTDWRASMPWHFSRSGVRALPGVASDCVPFVTDNFPQLVDSSAAAEAGLTSVAKHRYVELSDCVELVHGDRRVGAFIGAPEDWSTYYCRILCVLPEYRKPIMLRLFGQQVLQHLAAVGVQRFCAETSPTNVAMTNFYHRMGFIVTGQRLSERWGPIVRYTKFLDDFSDRAFSERFG